MDLAKAPIDRLASLVANNRLQLGEIPRARRFAVEKEARNLTDKKSNKQGEKGANKKKGGKGEAVTQPSKPSHATRMTKKSLAAKTVKDLLEIASSYPSIKYESRMRKADLIDAILTAQENTNAG